jgi:twitching motility two-component system response regulator PilH
MEPNVLEGSYQTMEQQTTVTREETSHTRQKNILVVDDDPEMRLALHIRLKANNYAVSFAVDGVSGIEEARRQNPDVILLDLGLPAGDGFTILERLQANDYLAAIPVIVVSGRDRAANRERSLKAGARIFLQKPVRNSDLLSAIGTVLSVKPPAAAPVVYDLGDASCTPLAAFHPEHNRKSTA